MPPRRCSIQCLHEQTAGLDLSSQEFCHTSRSEMDHGGFAVPTGDGCDCNQAPGVRQQSKSFRWWVRSRYGGPSAKAETKGQVSRKRQRKRWSGHRRRGCLEELSTEGPEPSPLDASTDFLTWALCLPRWILKTRTPFSWAPRKSFTAEWGKPTLPTAVFPLPDPFPILMLGKAVAKKKIAQLSKEAFAEHHCGRPELHLLWEAYYF